MVLEDRPEVRICAGPVVLDPAVLGWPTNRRITCQISRENGKRLAQGRQIHAASGRKKRLFMYSLIMTVGPGHLRRPSPRGPEPLVGTNLPSACKWRF